MQLNFKFIEQRMHVKNSPEIASQFLDKIIICCMKYSIENLPGIHFTRARNLILVDINRKLGFGGI